MTNNHEKYSSLPGIRITPKYYGPYIEASEAALSQVETEMGAKSRVSKLIAKIGIKNSYANLEAKHAELDEERAKFLLLDLEVSGTPVSNLSGQDKREDKS